VLTLRAGERLRSNVCTTVVIVVRAPSVPVDLRCGGSPMRPFAEPADGRPLDAAYAGGTLIGKRYADADSGLEVLCTKNGEGALSIGTRMLGVMEAKALPSSD